MIGAVFGSVAAYLAGSLLWRLALLLVIAVALIWAVRRIFGRAGQPPAARDAALLLPMMAVGIWVGWQHGGAERATMRADLRAAAERIDQAEADKAALERRAADIEARAKAEAAAAAKSQQRLAGELAAINRRSAAVQRRIEHVSRSPDGSIARVPDGWVRDYNAALGIPAAGVLPAPAGSSGASGGSTGAAGAAGGRVRDPGPARAAGDRPRASAQPAAPGLLAPAVTIADVLSNHTDNAAGCAASRAQLVELQSWYKALQAQRNGGDHAMDQNDRSDAEP